MATVKTRAPWARPPGSNEQIPLGSGYKSSMVWWGRCHDPSYGLLEIPCMDTVASGRWSSIQNCFWFGRHVTRRQIPLQLSPSHHKSHSKSQIQQNQHSIVHSQKTLGYYSRMFRGIMASNVLKHEHMTGYHPSLRITSDSP